MGMCDSIEEIQESKKRRQKGIDAWAEMLERMKTRGPAQVAAPQESPGGGSGMPHDSVYMSDPKTMDDRKNRLEAVKASTVAAQAEARRTQDTVQTRTVAKPAVKPEAPKAQPSKAAEAPPPRPVQAPQPVKSNHHHPAPVAAGEVQIVQEEVKTAVQGPQFLQENSKEASEQRAQLSTMAGVPQPKEERVDLSAEEAVEAAQEAAQLAALRSGVGADPSKVAKEYILACDIPGVKDTFQGGIYENFMVAL